MKTVPIPSRREFIAAVGVLAASDAVSGQENAKLPDTKAYNDAIEVVVRYRFGKHLTDDQLKRVIASAQRGRLNGEALRATALSNGEDPITAFRADLP